MWILSCSAESALERRPRAQQLRDLGSEQGEGENCRRPSRDVRETGVRQPSHWKQKARACWFDGDGIVTLNRHLVPFNLLVAFSRLLLQRCISVFPQVLGMVTICGPTSLTSMDYHFVRLNGLPMGTQLWRFSKNVRSDPPVGKNWRFLYRWFRGQKNLRITHYECQNAAKFARMLVTFNANISKTIIRTTLY